MRPSQQPNGKTSGFAQTWVMVVGVCFLGFAVLFLAGLVVAHVCNLNVACGPLKPFIIAIVSLCIGAAWAFLGGWANATGAIPLSKIGSPLQINVGGGGALILIAALVMNSTFVCPDLPKRLRITGVEGSGKPGENLTVSYEAEGLPAGSRLALDYSTDRNFGAEDDMRTELINDPTLRRWTFRISPAISDTPLWLRLRVLDAQDKEIDRTKPIPAKQ